MSGKRVKKSQAEELVFTILDTILLLFLLVSLARFAVTENASKAEAYRSVESATEMSLLVSLCFKDAIDIEQAESCIYNINDRIRLKITDLVTGESHELSNSGFPAWSPEYSDIFVYPLKNGNEIHPARVELEFRIMQTPGDFPSIPAMP